MFLLTLRGQAGLKFVSWVFLLIGLTVFLLMKLSFPALEIAIYAISVLGLNKLIANIYSSYPKFKEASPRSNVYFTAGKSQLRAIFLFEIFIYAIFGFFTALGIVLGDPQSIEQPLVIFFAFLFGHMCLCGLLLCGYVKKENKWT